MKVSITLVTLLISVIVSTLAVAGLPTARPVSVKKQLGGCMTKQMSVSRTTSYYDAMKLCKTLIKSQEESLIASNEAKPAHAH